MTKINCECYQNHQNKKFFHNTMIYNTKQYNIQPVIIYSRNDESYNKLS